MKKYTNILLAMAFLLFAICTVQAQVDQTAPLADTVSEIQVGPTITDVKLPGGIPVLAVVSLLATLLTSVVKIFAEKLKAKIPGGLLPVVVGAISMLLDWLSTLTFGTTSNPWMALAAGVGAVGLFALKEQYKPNQLPK